MADYPTLVKTWQYSVNQAITASGVQATTAKNLMFALFQSLITFGSSAWVCRGSSNGTGSFNLAAVGSGTPGTNYWSSGTANIVWNTAGNNHSWAVLRQTGIGAQCEILIDLNSANTYAITVLLSPSVGFSGGSATTAPTASDSVALISSGAWGATASGDITYQLHAMQSTDGASTRILICEITTSGGRCCGFLSLDLPQNPVTGWSNPVHGIFLGSNSQNDVLTVGNLVSAANGQARAANAMTLAWTLEYTNGLRLTATLLAPNDLNGEYLLCPVGLYSATASNRGRHGSLFDIWFGNEGLVTGQQFGGAADKAFAQFGILVLPWNATIAKVS